MIYRHDFLICPWCGAKSGCRVDHLYGEAPRGFGPWYCEACGEAMEGTVQIGPLVQVHKAASTKRMTPRLVLLKRDGPSPVYFVVSDHDHIDGVEPTDEERQVNAEYLYEEHSCPTNWLRDVVAVIEDGDADPHGFLSFVRACPSPPGFDEHDVDWATIFPEAFGGKIIDVAPTSAQKRLGK